MTSLVFLALLAGAPAPAGAEATLPPGATVRLGTLRFRHSGGSAVAFSPNGKLLATDDVQGTIALCDVPSGWLRHRLVGHTRGVYDLAFTPDGKRVISTGNDWTMRVWDTATGKQLDVFYPGHEERAVWRLAVSPDGKLLASSGEAGKITLRQLPGGKVLKRLPGTRLWGHHLQFSPDSKTLAGSSDSGLAFFDTDTAGGVFGKELRALKASVKTFAFTPDGKSIWTLSDRRGLRLLDVATGEQKKVFTEIVGHSVESVACLAGDKQLACVCWEGRHEARHIYVLNAQTGKRLHRFAWHSWVNGQVRLAVSPDDRTLAVVGQSAAARLWDGVTGKEIEPDPGHYHAPTSLAFTRDGKQLITGSSDNTVRVWNVAKGKQLRRIDAEHDGLWTAAVTPDGRTVATGGGDRKRHV